MTTYNNSRNTPPVDSSPLPTIKISRMEIYCSKGNGAGGCNLHS